MRSGWQGVTAFASSDLAPDQGCRATIRPTRIMSMAAAADGFDALSTTPRCRGGRGNAPVTENSMPASDRGNLSPLHARAITARLGAPMPFNLRCCRRWSARRSKSCDTSGLPRLAELGVATRSPPWRPGRRPGRCACAADLAGTPTLYYGDEIGIIRPPSPRMRCAIPLRRTCRASASAATAVARRCNGTLPMARDFRMQSRGCRWPMITGRMSPRSMPMPLDSHALPRTAAL